MIREHGDFSPPRDFDPPLWRYVPTLRAIDLLESRTLYFPSADLLGDEHEGSIPRGQDAFRRRFYEGATESFLNTGLGAQQLMIRKLAYASCWHVNPHESELLWNRYGTDGVAIRSSLSRLRSGIVDTDHEFLLRPVGYLDYDDELSAIWEGNAFNQLFVKRAEFHGDQEFRIIAEEIERFNDLLDGSFDPPAGLKVPIDPTVLIDIIVIHPRAAGVAPTNLEDALNRSGLSARLRQSSLAAPPRF